MRIIDTPAKHVRPIERLEPAKLTAAEAIARRDEIEQRLDELQAERRQIGERLDDIKAERQRVHQAHRAAAIEAERAGTEPPASIDTEIHRLDLEEANLLERSQAKKQAVPPLKVEYHRLVVEHFDHFADELRRRGAAVGAQIEQLQEGYAEAWRERERLRSEWTWLARHLDTARLPNKDFWAGQHRNPADLPPRIDGLAEQLSPPAHLAADFADPTPKQVPIDPVRSAKEVMLEGAEA